MKLAEESFIILGCDTVELRPSLRHALRLERRSGGFRQLLVDLQEGSLTAALDIVAPHADNHVFLEHRVMAAMPSMKAALTEYVLACAGMDGEIERTDQSVGPSGKAERPRPFAEYLTDLYRYGTGWMGWTPEATLDATPGEISLAFEGHVEMLRALHGSGNTDQPADNRPLDDKFKSIFAGIGTTKVEA